MRIFRSLEEVPVDFGPSIVSVGNFDGVHIGHQLVLKEMVKRARTTGNKAIVVTFDPHPVRILRPDVAPKLITPQALKESLLADVGLDALLVIPFTRDFSLTSASDFAKNILAGRLRAQELREGENFHFGHNAPGTLERLTDYGREFRFGVKACKVTLIRVEPVSGSHIRGLS